MEKVRSNYLNELKRKANLNGAEPPGSLSDELIEAMYNMVRYPDAAVVPAQFLGHIIDTDSMPTLANLTSADISDLQRIFGFFSGIETRRFNGGTMDPNHLMKRDGAVGYTFSYSQSSPGQFMMLTFDLASASTTGWGLDTLDVYRVQKQAGWNMELLTIDPDTRRLGLSQYVQQEGSLIYDQRDISAATSASPDMDSGAHALSGEYTHVAVATDTGLEDGLSNPLPDNIWYTFVGSWSNFTQP